MTITSRIAKHFKNIEVRWKQSLVSRVPSTKKTLSIAAKNYAETNIKPSWSCLIKPDSFTPPIIPLSDYRDH